MMALPRVRWLALLLALAFGLIFVGSGFDLAGALAHWGSRAAALAAGLLSLSKMIQESLRILPQEEDPMVYTQGRGPATGAFWRRVL